MREKTEQVGNRWYKCDFHLHTPASQCFADREVTPKQWVERAIEQGLDCVAITDHNSNKGIDGIIEAAEGTSLTVFPGVEITCDTTKIHLLIMFDRTKSAEDVGDFLIKAKVDRKSFGNQEASTTESIFDIADLAKDCGALLIPAHIDDKYNSLIEVGDGNLKTFFSRMDINAVQILSNKIQTKGPVKNAREASLSLLTFSDNPHAQGDSKHGLWGIGKSFTWIKMGAQPCLEGLRQAFLLPEVRVRNHFHANIDPPYEQPQFWIRSLKVEKTLLNQSEPLRVNFSPQLTSIIGSRGSGKSSVLRFIRGALEKTEELENLKSIYEDQKNFYKEPRKDGPGVFKTGSVLILEFLKNRTLYRLKATNITATDKQDLVVERFDNDLWCQCDIEVINQLQVEQYSQKQIFELAQKPSALRKKIDNAIPGLQKLEREREAVYNNYLSLGEQIRSLDKSINERGRIEHQLEEVKKQIESLSISGISELQKQKHSFDREQDRLEMFIQILHQNRIKLSAPKDDFQLPQNLENHHQDYGSDLETLLDKLKKSVQVYKNAYITQANNFAESVEEFTKGINDIAWKKNGQLLTKKYVEKKEELKTKGIRELDASETYEKNRREYERELDEIRKTQKEQSAKCEEKKGLLQDYLNLSEQISQQRQKFIDEEIKDQKLQISVKSFRDAGSFESKLRHIIARDESFEADIQFLCETVFNAKVENGLFKMRSIYRDIFSEKRANGLTQKFQKLINELSPRKKDELIIFLPEDSVEIKYKKDGEAKHQSLSNSSPGEKTTAILTFILSYGKNPLILDQPEDDLDNRLIYDLIVDRLKKTKEFRQIIVVTHNANIPVNGDAEYVISMAAKNGKLSISKNGTIDEKEIKNEIRNVMEGGEKAFQMRAQRYQHIDE